MRWTLRIAAGAASTVGVVGLVALVSVACGAGARPATTSQDAEPRDAVLPVVDGPLIDGTGSGESKLPDVT
jgi:hypothetical protein